MARSTAVTLDELKAKWMDPQARGLRTDHQAGVKIVTMADGSEYVAPLPREAGRA